MPPSCLEGQLQTDRVQITNYDRRTSFRHTPLRLRSGAKVTLYEKEQVFGGHTLTDDSSPYPVDLGFQVLALDVPRPCHPHAVPTNRSTDCESAGSRHGLCHQGDVSVMSTFKMQRLT